LSTVEIASTFEQVRSVQAPSRSRMRCQGARGWQERHLEA